MRLALAVVLLFSSCLGTGCVIPVTNADKLFGSAAQQPKLKVKKGWGTFSAEASTDFAGTMDGTFKPETGEVTLKAAVASTATPVIGANAELIKSMETIRIADINASVAKTQEVTKQMQHIADVARALGEAGAEVVGQMVETIAGSTIGVTTPFGLGLSGTLGTPQPLPVVSLPVGPVDTMSTTTISKSVEVKPKIVIPPTGDIPTTP